jgi:spermidine synthase
MKIDKQDPTTHRSSPTSQQTYFLFVAFIVGMFTIGIEKAITRLLITHIGSTLYTDLGVTSALMLSLAIGYSMGGYMASRLGSPAKLYLLILGAGAYAVLLAYWAATGATYATAWVTIRPFYIFLSAFSTTLLLISIPYMVAGMIISFIIQLIAKEPEKAGKTIGKIIAWSALGGMTGGPIATFIALPFLGIQKTILYTGLPVLLIATIGIGLLVLKNLLLLHSPANIH